METEPARGRTDQDAARRARCGSPAGVRAQRGRSRTSCQLHGEEEPATCLLCPVRRAGWNNRPRHVGDSAELRLRHRALAPSRSRAIATPTCLGRTQPMARSARAALARFMAADAEVSIT